MRSSFTSDILPPDRTACLVLVFFSALVSTFLFHFHEQISVKYVHRCLSPILDTTNNPYCYESLYDTILTRIYSKHIIHF